MGSCLGYHPQVGAPIPYICYFSLIKRIGRWYWQLLRAPILYIFNFSLIKRIGRWYWQLLRAPILYVFNFSLIKRIGRWYGQLFRVPPSGRGAHSIYLKFLFDQKNL